MVACCIAGACPLASDWLTPPSWIKERSQESTRSTQVAALLAEIGRGTPESGLAKHGYYAIRNGWLHLDVLGTDKVRQLWSGTTEVDLDRLMMSTSKSRPETTFISKAARPATATAPPSVDKSAAVRVVLVTLVVTPVLDADPTRHCLCSNCTLVFRSDSGNTLARIVPRHRLDLAHAGVVFVVASLSRSLWQPLASFVRVLPSPWSASYYDNAPSTRMAFESEADLTFVAEDAVAKSLDRPFTKRKPQCVWRGAASGIWDTTPRGKEEAGRYGSAVCQLSSSSNGSACGTRYAVVDALKGLPDEQCDVAFYKSAISHPEDYVPPALIRSKVRPRELAERQCLLVLDGWGWPGNLRWVLESGSVALIATTNHIGFFGELEPWGHYVPLAVDGSDAVERVQYVLDPRNRAVVAAMASKAQSFVKTQLTPKRMRGRLARMIHLN